MMLQNENKAVRKKQATLILGLTCSLLVSSFLCCIAEEVKPQPTQSDGTALDPTPKLMLKPGQPIVTGMQTEDIAVTEDVELAKEQVAAYPESPEASFILAVALTRTSMVEQALKEVRRARKLADKQGGPDYFDHMIAEYEDMLKSYPEDNRIRYGLAWAYYMKAYVLARYSKKVVATPQAQPSSGPTPPPVSPPTAAVKPQGAPWQNNWVPALLSATFGDQGKSQTKDKTGEHSAEFQKFPHIPGALEQATPDAIPQIRKYYDAALGNLDELLVRKPDDIWARVYRAFLYAEYTGDLAQSMTVWRQCQSKAPDNPAPYFFLGEGYLRQGNLKECLQNVSKAIALRSLGK
jgi:hypothetical protein